MDDYAQNLCNRPLHETQHAMPAQNFVLTYKNDKRCIDNILFVC